MFAFFGREAGKISSGLMIEGLASLEGVVSSHTLQLQANKSAWDRK